ncbi:hypothetical protein RJ639_033891 [Escallonia herrerae]|uniref:Uncharacterized protein n=1 Tax=Escallonia herrerae TaxID=1293975 RepID=A0AA88WWU0_9ASTE|nr:hypothetical protein RJ639_033891 [Escallonia herrerae]
MRRCICSGVRPGRAEVVAACAWLREGLLFCVAAAEAWSGPDEEPTAFCDMAGDPRPLTRRSNTKAAITFLLNFTVTPMSILITCSSVFTILNIQQRCTEDGVNWIHGDLVLRRIADEPLGVGEGDVRRSRPIALVVGDDLDVVVLPHADARVGRAEIYPDRGSLTFSGHGSRLLLLLDTAGQKRDIEGG